MFVTSEQIDQIATALADAQTRIGNALKDAKNPAFRSSYATLASVDDAVRPELSAVGIAIIQAPSFIPDISSVEVVTRLVHKSGQFFQSSCLVPVTKVDAQGTGSAITYARRYALSAMCGVAPADDDDANAAVGKGATSHAPQRSQPAPAPQQNRQPQANPVSDDKRAENAAKVEAIVREYGNDSDIAAWEVMDKQDKMNAYRRACLNAKKVDPGFVAPL